MRLARVVVGGRLTRQTYKRVGRGILGKLCFEKQSSNRAGPEGSLAWIASKVKAGWKLLRA